MSDAPIEEKIVFLLGPPAKPGDKPVLMFGIPEGAWEYMKDGLSHDFDFSSVGLPIQALIFRGKDHADVMRQIEEGAAEAGIPLIDERRKDFSMNTGNKEKGDG